jgi:dolichol-phosphate mannosyltransferase
LNGPVRHISIIIPTYNERQNIVPLIDALGQTLQDRSYEIIVVDDNSPDGTYQAVQEVVAVNPLIKGIRRPGKLGLASAVMDGFRASTGDTIVMMDADFSHRPQDLPRLLAAASDADIVIGSRYIPGGGITGWSPLRHLASRTAIWLSKLILGLRVHDTSSGFALFKRKVLENAAPHLRPAGFKLMLEVLVLSPQARVVETPITFANRRAGKSKFGSSEVFTFLRLCLDLRRRRKAVSG